MLPPTLPNYVESLQHFHAKVKINIIANIDYVFFSIDLLMPGKKKKYDRI